MKNGGAIIMVTIGVVTAKCKKRHSKQYAILRQKKEKTK